MIKSFQAYLKFFQKYLGWRLFAVLLFTFAAAIAESIGILLFVPVIGQFGIATSIVSNENFIIDLLSNIFDLLNISFSLENTLILIGLSFIAKGSLVFASYAYSARLRGHLLFILKSTTS